MRATLIYGAGDVRVEDVPDPRVQEATDAVVRVLRSCICGSDLWPYGSMPASEQGQRIGHEFLGVVEDIGSDVSGLKAGDVVVAPFAWADNTCDFCAAGVDVRRRLHYGHPDHDRARGGGCWMAESLVVERGVLTASGPVWDEAWQRAAVIGRLAEKSVVGLTAADKAAAELGISRRQVYVLVGRWRAGEGVVTDLLPGRSSGGRGTGWLPDAVEAIGRPYITAAIDVCSRCVVGLVVTLEAPSATSPARSRVTCSTTTTWARPSGTPCGKEHTVRRGQGYSLHVTAAPHVHHALLAAAAPLGADGAASAARKAYRIYADRLTAATILTDPAL